MAKRKPFSRIYTIHVLFCFFSFALAIERFPICRFCMFSTILVERIEQYFIYGIQENKVLVLGLNFCTCNFLSPVWLLLFCTTSISSGQKGPIQSIQEKDHRKKNNYAQI